MTDWVGLIAILLVAGWATTYVWRFVGVYIGQRMAPDSELLMWVRAVATALVSALVVRLLLVPPGMLGHTTLEARIVAMAAGIAGFYLFGRGVGAAVATAAVSLFVITWGLDRFW